MFTTGRLSDVCSGLLCLLIIATLVSCHSAEPSVFSADEQEVKNVNPGKEAKDISEVIAHEDNKRDKYPVITRADIIKTISEQGPSYIFHFEYVNISQGAWDEMLKHKDEIESIVFIDTDVSDYEITHFISKFSTLNFLSMHKCYISPEGMRSLANLKDLMSLCCSGFVITSPHLEAIASITSLTELSLQECSLGDLHPRDLEVMFRKLDKLTQGVFQNNDLTDRHARIILQHEWFSLDLSSNWELTDGLTKGISKGKMRRLEIDYTSISINGLKVLLDNLKVKYLDVSATPFADGDKKVIEEFIKQYPDVKIEYK